MKSISFTDGNVIIYKSMNKFLTLCTIILVSNVHVLAQQCKYDIALSSGIYNAPNFKNATSKTLIAADFDYHLLKRWTISTGFLSGQFTYFDDWRSNYFSYDDYTNARGYESHFYLTATYSVIFTNRLSIQIGSGAGLFTQRLKYPYRAPSSWFGPRNLPYFTAEESYSKFEIPVKVEAFYMLGARIGLGVRAGAFVQKNRFFAGAYVGPQVRIRIN